MWTPRRVGLLLLGVALFAAAYLGYSFALGSLDGLPALPESHLKKADGKFEPRYQVPNTILRLIDAFGPQSPESGNSLDYVNRLQLKTPNEVIACGSPVTNGTPLVAVAPVSLALFGKPPTRQTPGEVLEISTFHADRAILRFDRPITKREEMFGPGVKIVGVELVSEPDDDPNTPTEKKDRRKGRIWMSHNRKSPDPADHIVVRTPGPLFIQMPDDATPHDPNVPHVWTSAAVEVFDRQNLPRKLRKREPGLSQKSAVTEVTENVLPMAALARPEDLRRHGAIEDILLGNTLPPPTVVSVGMKVFLNPSKPATNGTTAPKPPPPERGGSFSGVREILLCDQVQMNLWADGTSGLPGSEPPPKAGKPAAAAPPPPNRDPPLAGLAVIGGLLDAGTLADRLENRSLLIIETPGAFRYDLEANTATFDVAAQPPPGRENFVVVTRLSAKNQTDYLVCSKLHLDFLDQKAAGARAVTETGLALRAVTAYGPQVYAYIHAEGLEASGAELRHVKDPGGTRTVTTLKGTPAAPVVAIRDGSKLTADDPVNDSLVEIVTTETPNREKSTVVSVAGPGRLELVDKAAAPGDRRGGVARWAKWLKHEKISRDGQAVDLLKFEEDARFIDPQAGFTLRARSIWLWVTANKPAADRPRQPGQPPPVSASPERLIATADVEVDSPDLVVRDANKLTVWFSDGKRPVVKADPTPPPVPAVAAKPGGADAPLPTVPVIPQPGGEAEPPKVATAQPPAPEPIPNPMHLHADTIETWVVRYPVDDPKPAAPGKPAPPPRLKYDLQKARCDDNVWAHQDPDPNDPNRPANGTDIRGNKLTLDHAPPNGSVLTVTGGRDKDNFAKVTFEDTTIYGPTVVIDQPNNTVTVDGRGRLRVLSSSDVQGNDLSTPSDLQIDFNKRMLFEGAKSFATFLGGVIVDQETKPDPAGRPAMVARTPAEKLPAPRDAGPAATAATKSTVWCHQLNLTLDRPVYFNQMKKADRAARDPKRPPSERPKVKHVVAVPKDDAAAEPHEKVVYFQEIALESVGPSRGRLLTAKQLDFANRTADRDWLRLDAAGPGELRLLQPESGGDANRPADPTDPNARVSARGPDKEPGELKLTVVRFGSKMVAKDQGNGAYQEAKFDDGAVVMSTPAASLPAPPPATAPKPPWAAVSDVLYTGLEAHRLPPKSIYLESRDLLTVSSTRTRRDAPADQRLTAIGNAVFRDDNRTGLGDRIVYDGTRVVLESEKRLANLQSNKVGLHTGQATQAKRFVYNTKTGDVEIKEAGGGSFGTVK